MDEMLTYCCPGSGYEHGQGSTVLELGCDEAYARHIEDRASDTDTDSLGQEDLIIFTCQTEHYDAQDSDYRAYHQKLSDISTVEDRPGYDSSYCG
jgi:hypothetical protein